MLLSTLLSELIPLPEGIDCSITGLALDSRKVQPGDLFFAYQGTHLDGREFIEDAIKKGACAVLVDGAATIIPAPKVPLIQLPSLHLILGKLAAKFYGQPADALRIVGVTGTNGKTSCSHFIAAALQELQTTCGVIGTLGSGLYGHIQPGSLTTPDALTLQSSFADFLQHGAKAVSMEVSSHSIDQGRVNGIPFEVGIFTNLTQDHLDYHGDMKTYGAVKKRLFDNGLCQHAVINADDEFGRSLIDSLHTKKDMIAYSVNKPQKIAVPVVYADKIQLELSGMHARVHTPWGEGDLFAPLVGQFNLSNLLAVLTTLCVMKFPLRAVLQSLAKLTPVAGRMEALGGQDLPLVVVDYSHTPDALEKALLALRQHCRGRLLCLFGCGGDRDRTKRPLMAKIAEKNADSVIVTDDNPRQENPQQIVADILKGFSDASKVRVEHDRAIAIREIIQSAKAGDCVLIAGKGAETYQIIGDKKLPFSDVEQVKKYIGRV